MQQARFFAGKCLVSGVILCISFPLFSQPGPDYWQQEIRYQMDVRLDVHTDRLSARQEITYKNNSPDVLHELFFHLYFNAFQPGSEMDVRSMTIPDPDPRIGDRISQLTPREQGYQKILRITQGATDLAFSVDGTILRVKPAKPIAPGKTIRLSMAYEAQVPLQIRRNGRDNIEGIRYSMAQWYPKMCEYDRSGWHTDPYIAREFYGVWGDFDVTISLDSAYTVAATGQLQNASSMGHGYGGQAQQKTAMTTWRFKASRVHDFVWAADPDYVHEVFTGKTGLVFHTFYQDHEIFTRAWQQLPAIMDEVYAFIREHFGPYPYSHFSIIQAGDGGMEYPMATLITGERPLGSLVGVTVHEFLHSWFYGVLGFNESLYYWMDEGFDNYAEILVMNHLKAKGLLHGTPDEFPFDGDFKNYYAIHTRGIEEPLSTHADHFAYNTAYGFAAYGKGSIFLHQLEYVIGSEPFRKGLLLFYDAWKFKHPDATDFIRIMEKVSGLQLDWYQQYMVYTTKTIDYTVDSLFEKDGQTHVTLVNLGKMPMPVDVEIREKNGKSTWLTIPIDLMRGAKSAADPQGRAYTVMPEWNWVDPVYGFVLPVPVQSLERITIDPLRRMADMDRTNNEWPRPSEEN